MVVLWMHLSAVFNFENSNFDEIQFKSDMFAPTILCMNKFWASVQMAGHFSSKLPLCTSAFLSLLTNPRMSPRVVVPHY